MLDGHFNYYFFGSAPQSTEALKPASCRSTVSFKNDSCLIRLLVTMTVWATITRIRFPIFGSLVFRPCIL